MSDVRKSKQTRRRARKASEQQRKESTDGIDDYMADSNGSSQSSSGLEEENIKRYV